MATPRKRCGWAGTDPLYVAYHDEEWGPRGLRRFDPGKVACFGRRKIESLLADPGIVRNRAKVEGRVRSARAFLDVVREHGSFDRYAG